MLVRIPILTARIDNLLLDGYFVCQGNYLSVPYYGENRHLQITNISTLESKESVPSPQTRYVPRALSPLKEDSVISKLLNLSLSPGPVEMSHGENETLVDTAVPAKSTPVVIHKITSKTKIKIRKRKEHAVEVCTVTMVLLCCSISMCMKLLCYEISTLN